MSDYEKLKSVIQKANPEIMELKFGVSIEYHEKEFVYVSDGMAGLYTIWSKPSSAIHVRPNEIKILGRPIRLADVLLAVTKILHPIGKTSGLDEDRLKVLWRWNLKNDNLDRQSKETKQFLIELLT